MVVTLTHAHGCTSWQTMWLVQSASQESRYSSSSFARKDSRQRTPTTESPTLGKHTRTIPSPRCCPFVYFRPPLVSTFVDLHFVQHVSRTHGLVRSYRKVSNYSARKINFKLQLALLIGNRKISLGARWRLFSMGFCWFREKIGL